MLNLLAIFPCTVAFIEKIKFERKFLLHCNLRRPQNFLSNLYNLVIYFCLAVVRDEPIKSSEPVYDQMTGEESVKDRLKRFSDLFNKDYIVSILSCRIFEVLDLIRNYF